MSLGWIDAAIACSAANKLNLNGTMFFGLGGRLANLPRRRHHATPAGSLVTFNIDTRTPLRRTRMVPVGAFRWRTRGTNSAMRVLLRPIACRMNASV